MIELPPLPWAQDALAPYIGVETMQYHYGKHHRGYVTALNELIEGTRFEGQRLEEIVRSSDGEVLHNAAQVWNHTFYWHSMRPRGGGKPKGAIADAIRQSFGGYDTFRAEFARAAATQFGSGWTWLVKNGDKLAVTKTANAETPWTTAAKPLLTIDLWEHAYYLDYRNLRPKYIDVFLDELVNWDFADENLG